MNGEPEANPDLDAPGPLIHWELRVWYPNEGGDVVQSGQSKGRALARRLRDHADELDRWSGMQP